MVLPKANNRFYWTPLVTSGRYRNALGVGVMVGEGDAVGVGTVGLGVAVATVGETLGVSVGVSATT